jgi:predicted TIM-barrel fold metal-dependent hydrolase
MNRRAFLKHASAAIVSGPAFLPAEAASLPVIDTHIHLFDPTRPGGVPWPEKSEQKLYRPALPSRYARLAEPHGILGAIAVECSPWLIDNFWLHDTVEANPIMLGFIGDLNPAATDFAATLDQLHRSPFFLGIRYGNLWNRNPFEAAHTPPFIEGLKLLAETGLTLDTANPNAGLLSAMLEISNRVPNLRIVIDHLPHAEPPTDAKARTAYDGTLRELAQHPRIFIKGSEIVRQFDGKVSFDLSRYKDNLDRIWGLFGDGRILFGSDWPNSDTLADYDDTFSIAQRYITTRSRSSQESYFWKNSLAAYKWRPRTAAQKDIVRTAEGSGR